MSSTRIKTWRSLPSSVQLLLLKTLHQFRVPLVELKRPESVLIQKRMQVWIAVRRPHKTEDEIKLFSLQQSAAKVVAQVAFSLAPVSDHDHDERPEFLKHAGVPSLHILLVC